jgi:hypothetical protein
MLYDRHDLSSNVIFSKSIMLILLFSSNTFESLLTRAIYWVECQIFNDSKCLLLAISMFYGFSTVNLLFFMILWKI